MAFLGLASEARLLLRTGSAMNPVIRVLEQADATGVVRRSLHFGAAAPESQSRFVVPFDPLHLDLPYVRGIAALLGAKVAMQPSLDVLVLGLGGGSLVSYARAAWPRVRVEAVEVDPVVLAVARSHFHLAHEARVHVGCARDFVTAAPSARWDVIVLDAFTAEGPVRRLATVEFLRECSRVLRPQHGVMLTNLWSSHQNPRFYSELEAYRTVFEAPLSMLVIPDTGNRIAVASNHESALLREHPRYPEDVARVLRSSLFVIHDLPMALPLRD